MKSLITAHTECINKVFEHQYFLPVFLMVGKQVGVIHEHPETGEVFDEDLYAMTDGDKIVSFWNSFWFALPDSREIQRPPFSDICDICENMFE